MWRIVSAIQQRRIQVNEKHDMLADMTLEQICRQQYEEIEKKRIQQWDLEEENLIYQQRVSELEEIINQRNIRIDELEKWCTYLQACLDKEKKYNIPARLVRKIKRIFCG